MLKSLRTENAILYTIKSLLKIAFGYTVTPTLEFLSEDNAVVRIEEINIRFKLCSQARLTQLLEGRVQMKYIFSYDNYYKIPVIDENEEKLYENNGIIQINYDIITLPFLLLSGYDEWVSETKDEFDRFKYEDSLVYKYNLISVPIVDEYAFLIREILKSEIISFNPLIKKTELIPTHDIDHLYRFDGFFRSLKSLLGEVREKRAGQFVYSLFNMIKASFSKKEDQYFKGIEILYNDSKKYGLKSVFFFMTAEPSQYDKGQRIDENILKLIVRIQDVGMKVGIHPGFNTFRNIEIMRDEIKRLRESLKSNILLSRQHYLRFDKKVTYKNLESCGIKVDYTMGFAEHEGFRCGTAHAFNPFNLENDEPYDIIEKPLIAMDSTLQYYQKYSIDKARNILENLFNIISRVEGDFIILWHNDRVLRDQDWYKEVYRVFISNHT